MEIRQSNSQLQRINKKIDLKVLVFTILLVAIGLLSIYSATLASNSLSFFYKQTLFAVLGLVALFATTMFPLRLIKTGAPFFYIATTILLVLVLFIGSEEYGTSGWLVLGGYSLQPAELAKLSLTILLAKYLSKSGNSLANLVNVGIVLALLLVPFALINQQPDFGTSITLFVIYLGIMFWSGGDIYYLLVLIFFVLMFFLSLVSSVYALILGTIGAVILLALKKRMRVYILSMLLIVGIGVASKDIYTALPKHQQGRINVFLDSDSDPQGVGYNVRQSVLAIGSGGLTGKGFGQGAITQLRYIPMQRTDFIYSVPAEEFGLIGAATILLLLLALSYRIINIAHQTKDLFGSIICFGVATNLLFHTMINIGMAIGIMPVMGIPLPFLSSGGTSLFTNMIAIGLVLNINRHIHLG